MAGRKPHHARSDNSEVGSAVDGMLKHWLLVIGY